MTNEIKGDVVEISTTHRKPRFRAGMEFGREPRRVEVADLSDDQIVALESDYRLKIVAVDADTESNGELMQILVDAIGKLSKDVPGHFTKKDIPEIKALEKIADVSINAEQRDAAFDLFKKSQESAS